MLNSSENVIKSWISASLVRKVGVGLVAMAVLMLLAIGSIFLQVQQQRTDAAVINVAGRQRTLSQLIANRTLRAIDGEAQAIEDLQAAADLFDRSLQGLLNGDVELGLAPAPAPVQSELDVVKKLWGPAYRNVQIVLETTSTGGQVRALALSLGERNDALLAASQTALTALINEGAPISTVSFAQRLPISAERITELVLKIEQGQIGVASQLAEEVRRFDEMLSLLTLTASASDDSPGQEQLLAMETGWEPFYADVQALLAASERGLQANRTVVTSSEPLLQASERVVTLFEREAQGKVIWLQQFLAGLTIIFLLVFGAVLWATGRMILPLLTLSTVAEQIGLGNLDIRLPPASGDEIGRLTTSFGKMTTRLRQSFATLEQEITERKRAEEALRESEKRFRQVITSITHHIYMTEFTKEGKHINRYLSPNIEPLTGYPLERFVVDWSFWPSTVIHPDDRAAAAAQAARLAKGQSSEVEYRLVRADGDIIWVRDSGQVEKDTVRQSLLVYGVVSDITKRKQAEQAMQQQRAFLQQVIDINPHFIFAKDRQGRFTLANQAFAKAYGATVEELLGKTDADFNPNRELVERYRHDDLVVMDSLQELFISEERIVKAPDRVFWRQTIKRPIVDEAGVAYQVLGVTTDITDRKQAEAELTWAHNQALEASRLKTQLLANVSHDLRTPLNAILGYSEMLLEGLYGPLTDQQRSATSEIIDSTGQLLNFVENLLDQAQIESGKVVLNIASFAPTELIDNVQSVLGVVARARGLKLTSDITPDLPPTLSGDPYWLRQILVNLVNNAIKFTKQGSVHIHVNRPDEGLWAIEVSDTGCGIPAEARSYIFDAFRQVDGTATRRQTGSGLGLSIVKQLTTMMGGQVKLTSQVGRGSTFKISLPLVPVQEKKV